MVFWDQQLLLLLLKKQNMALPILESFRSGNDVISPHNSRKLKVDHFAREANPKKQIPLVVSLVSFLLDWA